jgi:hypothetical protein
MPTASFWTWPGWDALVALGTLALASVTVALVGFTYLLARQTKSVAHQAEADVRAQWRRIGGFTLESARPARDGKRRARLPAVYPDTPKSGGNGGSSSYRTGKKSPLRAYFRPTGTDSVLTPITSI